MHMWDLFCNFAVKLILLTMKRIVCSLIFALLVCTPWASHAEDKCMVEKDSTVTICNNQVPFVMAGQTFYISAEQTLVITDGPCDTTVHLHLTVLPTYNITTNAIVAKDNYYEWDGKVIDTSQEGVFPAIAQHTHTSTDGCDSIVTLNLTVKATTFIPRDSTRIICDGQSYNWFGTSYSASGDYSYYKRDVASKRKFSINSSGKQVVSAPGNLLYNASLGTHQCADGTSQPGTWKFAENQWDYIGDENKNMAADYNGWMDLFGWGTSGFNRSKPYIIDNDNTLYGDGVNDIAGTNFDWGIYNQIGDDPYGTWYCMSKSEWEYLVGGRTNAAALRSVATVNGVHGFILLPDEWQQPAGVQFTPDADSYTTNRYSIAQWALLEEEGAIFLPAGGWRDQRDIKSVNIVGYYWTTTVISNTNAWEFKFGTNSYSFSEETFTMNKYRRYSGNTVRLVRDYDETSFVDSVYTLHLTVLQPLRGDTSATFCQGGSFIWHGASYSAEGDYTHTYTSKVAPYCDSIVTLHLTQLEPTDSIEYATICAGESYTWHGNTFSTSTDETEILTNAAGCDSICELHLTVLQPLRGDTSATFCQGSSFNWHGASYSAEGDYTHTYTSKVAPYCDSIVTLHLTQLEPTDSIEYATICAGESYTWHGNTYTTSTDETEILTNAAGCDSVCELHLTILLPLRGDTSATFCQGGSFVWHGASYSAEGDYTHTYTSKVAPYCDSIVTLHLTQLEPTDSIEYATICAGESYTWHGKTYTASADETETLTNAAGCDSVCTLHLTSNPIYTDISDERTICEGDQVQWEGETYTQPTDILRTLTSIHGCDSIVHFILHVNPAYHIEEVDTVLNGASYTWNGTERAPGDYNETFTSEKGCDSIVSLHLHDNQVNISELNIDELCADNDLIEFHVVYTGIVHQARILFDDNAHARGWRDTVLTIAPDGYIAIPNYGIAGRYDAVIELLFREIVAASAPISLTLLYPSSVLEQAWNDVVAVLADNYNGGYHFVDFQWYENGVLLAGETHSYIYRPLIMGGEYRALLTEENGMQLLTCPLIAEPHTDITLYPTIASPNQIIKGQVGEEAEIIIHGADGKLIMHTAIPAGNYEFTAPVEAGLYLVNMHLPLSDTRKTYKLLIR